MRTDYFINMLLKDLTLAKINYNYAKINKIEK